MNERPSVAEVLGLLYEMNSLLVHFSSTQKGDKGVMYPKDLQDVLQGKKQGGICCSTVSPKDKIDLNCDTTKSVGYVGAVVRPLKPESLMYADSCDCGSTSKDGILIPPKEDINITIDDLRSTITERKLYNEWDVRDYDVIGILAIHPYCICKTKRISIPEEHIGRYTENDDISTTDIVKTSIEDIKSEFEGQRIFSFENGEIVEYVDDRSKQIRHEEIYLREI